MKAPESPREPSCPRHTPKRPPPWSARRSPGWSQRCWRPVRRSAPPDRDRPATDSCRERRPCGSPRRGPPVVAITRSQSAPPCSRAQTNAHARSAWKGSSVRRFHCVRRRSRPMTNARCRLRRRRQNGNEDFAAQRSQIRHRFHPPRHNAVEGRLAFAPGVGEGHLPPEHFSGGAAIHGDAVASEEQQARRRRSQGVRA